MKILLPLLLAVTVNCLAQTTTTETVYNRAFMSKYAEGKKHVPPNGLTSRIVRKMSKQYQGEKQQLELVKFYKGVYDLKIADKTNVVAIPKYYVINREGIVIKVADKLDAALIESLK